MTEPAAPTNAIEAKTALDARQADPAWGAKLFAGDPNTKREWNELTTMLARADESTVAAAMSNKPVDTETRIMAGGANMLRDIGIKENIIAEVLKGHLVTEEEYKLTQAWKTRHMKDPEFVTRFLNGDVDARQKMWLADIIISGGIKGKSAI